MQRMAAAATAKLLEFQPVRRILFVFRRNVISFLTFRTLQNNIISRHNLKTLWQSAIRGGNHASLTTIADR